VCVKSKPGFLVGVGTRVSAAQWIMKIKYGAESSSVLIWTTLLQRILQRCWSRPQKNETLSEPRFDILGHVVLNFKLKLILKKNSIASFKQMCYSLTDTEVFPSTVKNTQEYPLKATAQSTKEHWMYLTTSVPHLRQSVTGFFTV